MLSASIRVTSVQNTTKWAISPMDQPAILAVAQVHDISPAQTILKWAWQAFGISANPRTNKVWCRHARLCMDDTGRQLCLFFRQHSCFYDVGDGLCKRLCKKGLCAMRINCNISLYARQSFIIIHYQVIHYQVK